MKTFAALFTVLALLSPLPAIAADPVRIIVVGDSTMTDKSGYGKGFCARFTPDVTCINAARGGRSSKSYRAEGLWDKVLEQLRDGKAYARTYVWIGFGHNDGSAKPERHTDLETEFPVNMRRYAQDIQAAGAIPVMVTPLTQRWFRNGTLKDDLRPWTAAIRVVATDGDYDLVDVYGVTRTAVQAMGPVAANRTAGGPIPQNILDSEGAGTSLPAVFSDASQGTPATAQAFDYTHLGPEGSALFGKIIVDAWAAHEPGIRPYLKAN
ncbi:GDSL-like Lipase/Acylhydrolase family protein [Asticcacaulis biprosthecium C19]|uniref:GDSL-like Lipase/Acylhydrolase family protein n=1 Tax=Asticcacaulis biprosthecium C19 TaxID=715226 RepID=F4QMX1_9CAUL|nr:SGNH/GDSL hydrolase family protein [Asticcacaulis biprosthecium]EGF91562.1 GDSL-like Lipase/Acylhydrolase family protein [Asticcacaulis biprosthecium C19]